eukprot:jgi/Mesvir1/7766/Mv11709-RA.1
MAAAVVVGIVLVGAVGGGLYYISTQDDADPSQIVETPVDANTDADQPEQTPVADQPDQTPVADQPSQEELMKQAEELLAEASAGAPKKLEDMTKAELTAELTKALALAEDNPDDPSVQKILEFVRTSAASKDDAVGLPSQADIDAVKNLANTTGIEKMATQTLSFLQRLYRSVLRYSADTNKDRFVRAMKTMAEMETDRLRSIRDRLASGSTPFKEANDKVNEFKARWAAMLSPMESWLNARTVGGPRSINAMVNFFIDFQIQTNMDNYVSDPFAWIRLDIENNTRNVLQWIDDEKFKLEPLGSKFVAPITMSSGSSLASRLKSAGAAAMDVEYKRLLSEYQAVDPKDVAGKAGKAVKLDEFKSLRDASMSSFNKAVEREPMAAMLLALWTFFDPSSATMTDVNTFVSTPSEWVNKSQDNAYSFRKFVFSNQFFQ